MIKLKKKLFVTISIILSLCAIVLVAAYNFEEYTREMHSIEQKLQVIELNRIGEYTREKIDEPTKPDGEEAGNPADNEGNPAVTEGNPAENGSETYQSIEPQEFGELRYIDTKVHTVLLDQSNNIYAIINHSNDDTTDEVIKSKAEDILKACGTEASVTHVGNLYTEKYSYSYKKSEAIAIINNSDVNERLKKNLLISLGIWLGAEIIFLLIAYLLTKWLIKPVQESFEKQKQFIADASHELKTPLTVIMASEEAYEKSHDNKWLDNIKSEADRMSNLVNNLLKLAQTEEGAAKETYEKLNLSKLIETTVLPWEAIMFEKNIVLNCNAEEDIHITGAADRLKELVTILIDNAVKHSEAGSEVSVSLAKSGQDIIIKITNKGEPIPEGEEEHIFERFYRGDKSHNRDANRYGLGLAIAKNIVEAHDGDIRAYSAGGYTTIEVRLH